LCQEEVNSPTSAKASRLRSHAHCGVQSFTSCAEAFHDGEETPRRRPAANDVEQPSWRIFPAKERKRPRQQKKEKTTTNSTENETAINSQFMHAKTH